MTAKPKNRLAPIEVVPDADAPAPLPATLFGAHLVKKLSCAPIPVQGTWEAARVWRDRATQAEEIKLYCQVMLGFELLHLREAHGETRGRTPTKIPFHDLAHAETGLGTTTVCKLVRMAEAAVGQLKQLPHLKGFDPTAQPIGQLPAPQQAALSAAVRKLTDGMTQTDFMSELGIWKPPQGRGAKGGEREREKRPRPGLLEKTDEEREAYREERDQIRAQLHSLGAGFVLTEDEEIRAEINFHEARCKAMRAWISKPHPERNLRQVEALLPQF